MKKKQTNKTKRKRLLALLLMNWIIINPTLIMQPSSIIVKKTSVVNLFQNSFVHLFYGLGTYG